MTTTLRSGRLVDGNGRPWIVVDFRLVDGERKRLPFGDARADGRAFVPDGWPGEVMLYHFGPVAHRSTEAKILADQLRLAKSVDTIAAQGVNGDVPHA